MAVLWGIGAQQADIGGQFREGFERGRAQRRQNALLDAQRQLAMDPNSQQGFNALAAIAPDQAMAYRQQQAGLQTQITERQRENIRVGARIVRQLNPQDQAGWDRALAAAQQLGVSLDGVPPTFDPAYRDQLLAAGQAMETPQQTEPTSFQRDDQYIRQRYGEQAGDMYVQRHIAPPPITRQNADGTITVIPQAAPPLRPQQQAQPQQPVTYTPEQLRAAAEEAIRNGADRSAVEAELQRMLGSGAPGANPSNEAPAFRPAPGGAASGQRNFP
jgi:hypothetical protein